MAKIIILEGIASSGKTLIGVEMANILSEKKADFVFVDESKTIMPILDNNSLKVAIGFLERLLDSVLPDKNKIVIFDRLHITHILRTNAEFGKFKKIENRIKKFDPLVVFLEISKEHIAGRLEWAMAHRDDKWREYVSKKGTKEEILNYYINQQRKIKTLISHSELPVAVYDTTGLDFKDIARRIFDKHLSLNLARPG